MTLSFCCSSLLSLFKWTHKEQPSGYAVYQLHQIMKVFSATNAIVKAQKFRVTSFNNYKKSIQKHLHNFYNQFLQRFLI